MWRGTLLPRQIHVCALRQRASALNFGPHNAADVHTSGSSRLPGRADATGDIGHADCYATAGEAGDGRAAVASFEQYPRDWHTWYTSETPETTTLPGEWDNACNELQKMLIVRSLRPDRVTFCATSFIINNLGSKFVEPPVLDMQVFWLG